MDGSEATFYSEVGSKEATIRNNYVFPPIQQYFDMNRLPAEALRYELFYPSKVIVLAGFLLADR